MYSNNDFNYGYDIEATIFSIKEDKEVGKITIREVADNEENANFVGGGIASGGHSYVVATIDDVEFIEAYKHKLIIDDKHFLITRKLKTKLNLEGRFSFCKSRKETVFYLE